MFALWLVQRRLPAPHQDVFNKQSIGAKLRRIDAAGAICMSLAIASTLLVFDLGGQKVPWDHPIIVGAAALAVTTGTAFVLVEKFWAEEPIFPLRLMTQYNAVNCYVIIALQNLTQSAVRTSG